MSPGQSSLLFLLNLMASSFYHCVSSKALLDRINVVPRFPLFVFKINFSQLQLPCRSLVRTQLRYYKILMQQGTQAKLYCDCPLSIQANVTKFN